MHGPARRSPISTSPRTPSVILGSPRRLQQRRSLTLHIGVLPFVLLTSACPGDDAPAGSGTGGDDEMPDDPSPGPSGPGCAAHVGPPPGLSPNDPTAASQLATAAHVVTLRADPDPSAGPPRTQADPLAPFPLTAAPRPTGATTQDPHIHERWGESRKHELSYCINNMPGEDAELEANYHKTIRALNSTMAEWERVTGSNFVHVIEDDTPEQDPHLTPQRTGAIGRPDCGPATNAYFGVFGYNSGQVQGAANAVPQNWNDPHLEPLDGGALTRSILLNSGMIASFGDATLLAVLRHELGHMIGFMHEEVNLPDQTEDGCIDPDPRPLTPPGDSASVLATPDCPGLSDADFLSHRDRLSAFFLQHTPRARFETRSPIGYRYAAVVGGGAEILWHTEGSTQGLLWHPQMGPGGLSFVEEPFPYSSTEPPPPGGWFPNESEVVLPLQLTGGPTTFDLLFYGPGPEVGDLAVFNSGLTRTAIPWSENAFVVPVVGRFDGSDLGRDVVYMYQPGTKDSTALVGSGGQVSIVTDVPQQRSWGMTSEGPSAFSTGPSFVWYFDETGGHEAKAFVLDADYSPYVGDFDADGCHDIGWFDAVDDTLSVWRCLPGARDFDCGAAASTPPNHAPVGAHWGF
jgi:hypothetical protein